MSLVNGNGEGNLLRSYIFKCNNIVKQVAEESELKVLISQLLINKGYKFTIVDEEVIDQQLLNNGWIPVNKELPEYNKHVLLYLKNNEGKETQVVGYLYFSKNKHLEIGNNNFSAYAGSDMPDFLIKKYVKAWRPLPELYKD